ncbi:hypothetical protein FB45DRAFT_1030310 [Roridomyces roridus]|uniref:DUF6534 domain-containing protein n=1 Tax=Roridomyces roridus TaxID=1738132 RepID=A0AAD7BNH0_9AGAR|nr:hypothetical protein FB45DRAFT_1030310 [Roridomyces roridus]
MVLELVHTIVVIQDAFTSYGLGFSNVELLTKVRLVFWLVPMTGGLTSLASQYFYAYRIRVLSVTRFMPCTIVTLSTTGSVAAILTGAFVLQVSEVAQIDNTRIKVAAGIWCESSALCDVLIASWMTYHLTRRDTGFRTTHAIISRLVRLIVETGTMTACCAVGAMILFLAFPNQPYYIAAVATLPKLQAIAVLVILNSRMEILGGRGTAMSHDMNSSVRFHGSAVATNGSERPVALVTIAREVFSDAEDEQPVEGKGKEVDQSKVEAI